MDLTAALESLVSELEKGLDQATSLEALESLRVDMLGRKGRIAHIMSQLPGLEPAMRPAVGQKCERALYRAFRGAQGRSCAGTGKESPCAL